MTEPMPCRPSSKKGAFADIYRDDAVQNAMNVINELDDELNKAAEWIVKQ